MKIRIEFDPSVPGERAEADEVRNTLLYNFDWENIDIEVVLDATAGDHDG